MNFGKTTKFFSTLSVSLLLVACSTGETNSEGTEDSSDFDTASDIHVVTREDGSGTRGSFVEIVDVMDENEGDITTPAATVQNNTSSVMQTVAGDIHSIGYISLGSLDNSVKGLSIDGIEPTPEAVANTEYEVARNFNVVYGSELSEEAQDFYNFFLSQQAQELVSEEGYVPIDSDASEYISQGASGNITVVGSTSVEPLMQRFAEAYMKLNPDVTIDITAPGSGAGITAAIEGSADIGMTSREIEEGESVQLEGSDAIAIDGIAIITHKDNPMNELSLEEISSIYMGDATTWEEVSR